MYVFRYPGSKVWTMEFVFHGQRIRETTKVRSKTLAKKVADKRRRELEEGAAGIKRKEPPKTFAVSSKTWLDIKKVGWSDRNAVIENNNIAHLLPTFGKKLLSDIEPQHIAQYQKARLDEGASNRTVNMEVGTLRAILKRSGHWARLLKDVTMLKPRKDVGKALPPEKVTLLLKACAESRSRTPGLSRSSRSAKEPWWCFNTGPGSFPIGSPSTTSSHLSDTALQVTSLRKERPSPTRRTPPSPWEPSRRPGITPVNAPASSTDSTT
jgi:hypothetical protein